MEMRQWEQSGLKTSIFGIGCMRLPLQAGQTDSARIDEAKAIRMIRAGIDGGVTYIDTAYPHHGGNSELVVGKALQDGYRERVFLATKLPVWEVKSADDFDRLLNQQLEKLQTDHVDFYLLHALHQGTWGKVRDLGVLEFLDRAKADGRIRYAAFSFHDQLPLFKEIIDSYAWDMCQIQLNILDVDYQAGLAGLEYAAARGIGVVVMEPLRGGALAAHVPADIQAVWDEASEQRSGVDWAFRWLANRPEVKVILSGVSTMEQLEDNLRIFADTKPGCLTAEDEARVDRVRALYQSKIQVDCTGCEYCLPCPSGVAIPAVFRAYNQAFMIEDLASGQSSYAWLVKNHEDASLCVECGACEQVCPQHIPIIEKLKDAHAYLG
ncbi:MAG: aldo/keto reductase [Clostridiales bacterium]|nr:aldo/keto reductase [Clostridiales bacterium]